MESNEFAIKEDLRQGRVLSSTLPMVMMNNIIKEAKTKLKKLHVDHRVLVPTKLLLKYRFLSKVPQ